MNASTSALRVLVVALLLAASAAGADVLVAKQVAAGPEDILTGRVRLPTVEQTSVASRGALLPLDFVATPRGWRAERELDVGTAPLVLGLVAPDRHRLTLRLGLGGEAPRLLAGQSAEGRVRHEVTTLADLAPGALVDRIEVPALSGTVRLVLSAEGGARPQASLLTRDPGGPVLRSAWASPLRAAGRPWSLRAWLEPTADEPDLHVTVARARIRAGETTRVVPLQPGPGGLVFTSEALVTPAGLTTVQVEVSGRTPAGRRFTRTTQQVTRFVAPPVVLADGAEARVLDPWRVELSPLAWRLGEGAVLVAAEVWGTDARGEALPVAWLATQTVATEEADGRVRLPLVLDVRWLDRVGAGLPLELRQVRVGSPGGTPHDLREHLALPLTRLPSAAGAAPGPVLTEMREGGPSRQVIPVAPDLVGPGGALALPRPADEDPARSLMLVHGYCSSGNPWPEAQFSEPRRVFNDPNQSRTHDAFAQLIAATGSDLDSFGVVGHSQGGPATLHLYTFYDSPLDDAVGPRRIQSLGSPYQGTPLAGNLAVLGDLFGAGCGTNDDLQPDGAAAWLSTIPTWAREEVFYWTTADDGGWCQFATEFFLSDPEDGVVERSRAQLPGANSMGHTSGWCHTTGMNDPAQTTDAARNAEMDAQAAR